MSTDLSPSEIKRMDELEKRMANMPVPEPVTFPKRYCFQIADADELQGLALSIDDAERQAREYAKEACDGPTKFIVWDSRPATPADAELWENCAEDEETAELTKQPNWWADKWVPENIVRTFTHTPA